MKKLSLFICTLLIVILLFIFGEIGEVLMPKYPYVQENSLLGISVEEIQSQWNFVDHVDYSCKTGDDLLRYWYSRWEKDGNFLVAVFKQGVISDYLIYDSCNHVLRGNISTSSSLKNTLSQIATNQQLHVVCDVGSGATINTAFTCDGYIVAWTIDKETTIFDAKSFKTKNVYFIYRLINRMLL